MSHEVVAALPWPLFTIDFETSSLVPGGYSIEVGVACWRTPAAPIESWSSVIQPIPLWIESGSWTEEARTVHGISPDELVAGLPPSEMLAVLNRTIGPQAAFCDGGASDFGWARRLVLAAGIMNEFRLGDFDMLVRRFNQEGRTRMIRWLDGTKPPQRARGGAERLMQALAYGLHLEPPVEDLSTDGGATSAMNTRCHQPAENSTSLTMAIQRELAKAARLLKVDRDDPRIPKIMARVRELATMRMNLTSA